MTVLKLAEKLAEPSRFLIVDDEIEVCTGLARGLAKLGCTAKVVHSGAAAIEAIQQERFSGVLLDIRMKGLTGIDVIREMRRLKIDVPVLIVTGFPNEEVYQLIDTYGALAVIVKPFSITELTDTLKRYFSIFNVRYLKA